MDSRTLLSDFKDIAHKLGGRYPNASRENIHLFRLLDNLSLDTTVTAPAQLTLLLGDLQTMLFEMGRMDKIPTSENTMTPEQQEANYDIRTDLSNNIKAVLHQLGEKYQLDPATANNAGVPRYFINTLRESINKQHPEMSQDPVNMRYKEMDRFNLGSALTQQKEASFTHTTRVVQKEVLDDEELGPKHESNWYAKFCEDKTVAGRELVIQELFRLLMPQQPKTRIAKNDDNEMFVMSKEVADAVPMSSLPKEDLRRGLNDGSIHGLGSILVASLVFNEVDVRLPNLMVDKNGQVVKIDGDWTLAAMRDDRFSSQITAADINALPRIENYTTYNWLDYVEIKSLNSAYALQPDKTILGPELQSNPGIRSEINETMLQILTLPNDFFKTFISKYLADPLEINSIHEELMFTQAQLRKAALKNPSFRDYAASNAAEVSANKFIANITNFKVMSDVYVLDNVASPPNLNNELSKLRDLAVFYAKNYPAPVAGVAAPAAVAAPALPPAPTAPTAQQILQNMQIANARANATAAAAAQSTPKFDFPPPPTGPEPKVNRKSVLDTMGDQVRAFFKGKTKKNAVAPLPDATPPQLKK
jgi:hypothetical protein